MQLEIDFSRGAKNALSREMHKSMKGTKRAMQLKVLSLIDGQRCTKEIADHLGKFLHQVSGRFSELKASGEIVEVGRKEYDGSKYTVYNVYL